MDSSTPSSSPPPGQPPSAAPGAQLPLPAPVIPPPATPVAVPAAPSGSDKIWAILSHLSFLIGFWFIIPLVVYLAMKDESDYARSNAREALNFHLSIFIYGVGCALLAFTIIAIPLVVIISAAMVVGGFVFAIIAAIKASDGEVYRYPLTLRLVK